MRRLAQSSICMRAPSVGRIAGPLDAAGIERAARSRRRGAQTVFSWSQLAKQSPPGLPWRPRPQEAALPAWIQAANLRVIETYSVPYGRRYALLEVKR